MLRSVIVPACKLRTGDMLQRVVTKGQCTLDGLYRGTRYYVEVGKVEVGEKVSYQLRGCSRWTRLDHNDKIIVYRQK